MQCFEEGLRGDGASDRVSAQLIGLGRNPSVTNLCVNGAGAGAGSCPRSLSPQHPRHPQGRAAFLGRIHVLGRPASSCAFRTDLNRARAFEGLCVSLPMCFCLYSLSSVVF